MKHPAVERIARRVKHRSALALRDTPLDGPVREHVLAPLRRRRGGKISAEATAWSTARREIEEALAEGGPVIVGPWLSELGFEVLYWIPFLTWVAREFNVDRDRVVVVSRGGAGGWYRAVADRHVDLLETMSPAEFHELSRARWAASGGQKQLEFDRFDRRVLAATGVRPTRGMRGVLHPSTMYRLFARFWAEGASINTVLERTIHERFAVSHDPTVSSRLPDGEYVAVKFYFRPSLPDDAPNRRAAAAIVSRLARRWPVVLLNTGVRFDDHEELALAAEGGRVRSVLDGVTPQQNLAAQATAIAGASAFFGTYGGLSYLAPALGVPSFAFYSQPEFFARAHLDLARRAAHRTGASLTCIDLRRPHALALMETA